MARALLGMDLARHEEDRLDVSEYRSSFEWALSFSWTSHIMFLMAVRAVGTER
jgi:hypothetical protein